MNTETIDPLNPNGYTLLNSSSVIKTYTGRWFDVFNPDIEGIHITDIAKSLSKQCRFSGHTQLFYSVAEHSVACSLIVPEEYRLAALLHDASEAYLVDVPRPIKKKLIGYKEIEDGVMTAIAKKYGFDYPFHDCIKLADEFLLEKEWGLLMHKNTSIESTMPESKACETFLQLFHQYTHNKFIHN